MEERIRGIIKNKLGAIDLEDEEILADNGMDSLDHIEIVMEIESEFNIEIDDEQASEAETILDFINIARESPEEIIH